MLLGGTIAGRWSTPQEWEALLIESRFKAVTAPFDCHTPKAEIDAYREICARYGVVIAEIGVWKNLFDPDPGKAAEALDYARGLGYGLADIIFIGDDLDDGGGDSHVRIKGMDYIRVYDYKLFPEMAAPLFLPE